MTKCTCHFDDPTRHAVEHATTEIEPAEDCPLHGIGAPHTAFTPDPDYREQVRDAIYRHIELWMTVEPLRTNVSKSAAEWALSVRDTELDRLREIRAHENYLMGAEIDQLRAECKVALWLHAEAAWQRDMAQIDAARIQENYDAICRALNRPPDESVAVIEADMESLWALHPGVDLVAELAAARESRFAWAQEADAQEHRADVAAAVARGTVEAMGLLHDVDALTERLAAADAEWNDETGDEPIERTYLRHLAERVIALAQGTESADAPSEPAPDLQRVSTRQRGLLPAEPLSTHAAKSNCGCLTWAGLGLDWWGADGHHRNCPNGTASDRG